MSIQVTPIPRLTVLTVPAFTLGTANTAGAAVTAVASDSTLLAFDATLPDPITFSQSGSVGAATVASRRDHAHAMVANPANLTLIGTQDADDDASLTVGGIDGTYGIYMVGLSNVITADDGVDGWFRMGDTGGIDSGASDYAYHVARCGVGSGDYVSEADDSSSGIRMGPGGIGNAAGEGISALIWLYRPTDGSTYPTISGTASFKSASGELRGGQIIGGRLAAITLTQVQCIGDSGNITTGRMSVWGLSNS